MSVNYRGRSDPVLEFMIEKYSDLEGSFYDCGAMQGRFSVLAAPHFKQVYAFEIWEGLINGDLKISADLHSNVEIIPFGLWDDTCVKTYQIPLDHKPSLGSLVKFRSDSYYSGETVEVECTSIDEFVKTHMPPSFIKLDVEGAEVLVLLGAVETLRRHHPPLYVEYHLDNLRIFGGSILYDLDYELIKFERQSKSVSRVGYVYAK